MNLADELSHIDAPPAVISRVQDRFRQMQEQVDTLSKRVQSLDIKNQQLAFELAYLRRIRFAASSEAFNAEQRQLFEDDLDQDIIAVEAEIDATPTAHAKPTRTRAGRQVLPEHLERIDVRHEPESCTCGHCQSDLVKMGEDISEQLDIIPAQFRVLRHIRP